MEINADLLIQAYSRIAHISHYHIFIIFVGLDIFSGYIKAFIKKDLDSKVGLRGIMKHLSIVALVFLICPYLWLLGYEKIAMFLLYSIVTTYGISIIENYNEISPNTLPSWLGQFFRRTKDEIDKIPLDEIENIEVKKRK